MMRKDAELAFKKFNENGKNVWMIHKIKNIPIELFNVAFSLASLDFIKFVRITNDSISASNEIEGMRIKIKQKSIILLLSELKLYFIMNSKFLNFMRLIRR